MPHGNYKLINYINNLIFLHIFTPGFITENAKE